MCVASRRVWLVGEGMCVRLSVGMPGAAIAAAAGEEKAGTDADGLTLDHTT